MLQVTKIIVLSISLLLIPVILTAGCGPGPPMPYQTLQIQDSSEAEGYDIYLYIAVKPGLPLGEVGELLEWLRDVKFADQNKIKIYVWDNPQAAMLSAMGDNIAVLFVDRENGVDSIEYGNI
ncbi:hypothetical protein KAU08_08295 [bacterium]|nr:hypothetical protein [bacterium]